MRKILFAGLAFLFFFSTQSNATSYTYTWASNSSTTWNLAANWTSSPSGGTYPIDGNGDNVVISTGNAAANPVLAGNMTVVNLTMVAKTLTINSGFTLTVTGAANFTGSSTITGAGTATFTGSVTANQPLTFTNLLAQVNMGTLTTALASFSAGTSTVSGITANCNFSAYLTEITQFYKSTFTANTFIKVTNSTAITSTGGNSFSGTTTIQAAGSALLGLSNTVTSTYNGTTTFVNSGTGGLTLGYGTGDTYGLSASTNTFTFSNSGASTIMVGLAGTSTFNGSIVVTSTNSTSSIIFGGSLATVNLGTTTNSRTISASGFTAGTVDLHHLVQAGTAAQTINLTDFASGGTGKLVFSGGSFAGGITASAPQVLLNGTTFNGALTLTQNGNVSTSSTGGNTFNASTYIGNSGSGGLFMNTSTGSDVFAAGLTLDNTGTGGIYPAYAGGPSLFNGNIVVNCSNSDPTANGGKGNGVVFGANGGTSTLGTTSAPKTINIGGGGFNGTLDLTKITVQGAAACASPTFVWNMSLGKLVLGTGTVFNVAVNLTAPSILLNGATFNCGAIIIKNGASTDLCVGGNSFKASTTIRNLGSGPFFLSYTSADIYGTSSIPADVIYDNGGTGGIYPACNGTTNAYYGNITVNCTNSDPNSNAGMGNGVFFSLNGGTYTLGTTTVPKSVLIGPNGFNGTLRLAGLIAQGSCSTSTLVYNMTGKLILGPSTTFNYPIQMSASQLLLNGATFNCAATLTKNGANDNFSDGGNIFKGTTVINNSGSGGLYLSNFTSDTYGTSSVPANVTYNNSSTGGIYPAYKGTNTNYYGTITTTCTACSTSNSVCVNGIMFGAGGGATGVSTLASGKTITASGFTNGILGLTNFIASGTTASTAQSIILTAYPSGAGTIVFGPGSTFNCPITSASAPNIYMNGANFLASATITKNGPLDNIGLGGSNHTPPSTSTNNFIFNNSGAGKLMFGPDTYNAYNFITFNNTGSGGIYPSNSGASNYGGYITVNCTSGLGIIFGNSGGTSTLGGASGGTERTITVGTGFPVGTLALNNFTINGLNNTQTITLGGTAMLLFGPNSLYAGPVIASAPQILLNGSTFNKTATITKNGATKNNSLGGNTFLGVTTITNSGSGEMYLNTGPGNVDTYGSATTPASVTFNAGTSYLYPAYAGNNYFYGNITNSGTPSKEIGLGGGICNFVGTAAQTISGNSSSIYNITINKSSNDVTLNIPVKVPAPGNVTLTSGKIITSTTNFLRINDGVSITGGSALSYVSGPLQKAGNTDFTFPVGKNNLYMPVKGVPTNAFDVIQAEAFSGTPPSNTIFDRSLNGISNCQYWNVSSVSGTSPVTVTLLWDNTTCTPIVQGTMKLGWYTGTLWKNVSSGYAVYNGTSGSISSIPSSSLGNFTLGVNSACEADPFQTDPTINWTQETSYDEFGNIIGQSRQYTDKLGRNTQSQVKNVVENLVFVTSTLYDVQGRAVLTTLPAPILGAPCFVYTPGLITNASDNPYALSDFDLPANNLSAGEINNPKPVGTGLGTVGWYYSSSNTYETFVPTTSYPYARVDYNDKGANVSRSSAPGEAKRMGQNHESTSASLPILWELNHYLSLRHYYLNDQDPANYTYPRDYTYKGIKTISKDQNGLETVSFLSGEGKLLATCLAGSVNGVNQNNITADNYYDYSGSYLAGNYFQISSASANVEIYLNGSSIPFYIGPLSGSPSGYSPFGYSGSIYMRSTASFSGTNGTTFTATTQTGRLFKDFLDIHLPLGTTAPTITAAVGTLNYSLTDLTTGNTVANLNNPGYYRIKNLDANATLRIQYALNYYNFTYYYYDDAGRQIMKIAPNGVNLASSAEPTVIDQTTYNSLGWVLSTSSNDRHLTEFVYKQDGNLRFSQNALQKAQNKFSYSNYNELNQLTESGEYTSDAVSGSLHFQNMFDNYMGTPLTGSVFTVLNSTDGIDNARCSEVVYSEYDSPDASLSSVIANYAQRYVNGNVSKTYKKALATDANNISTTWYSYNESGLMEWSIQNISGLGAKTIDYTYDQMGNVLNVVYQQNTSAERFEHFYKYDQMKRLKSTYTRRLSTDDYKSQANYIYYLHGPLKRTEIENQLQGIDYTYTISGQLKAINHPALDANDPGGDSYTLNPGFSKDAFGMILEYYDNDYTGDARFNTSTNIAAANSKYNGIIRSTIWNTNNGSGNPTAQYVYTYDNKYQLTQADFGTNATNLFTIHPTFNYQVSNISYDNNGNLLVLKRNTNVALATKDDISYQYANGPNQLTTTKVTSTNTVNRTFSYDQIGQMTASTSTESGEINKYVNYDVIGNVTAVYADAAKTQLRVSFLYDEKGARIKKSTYDKTTFALKSHTWYVRDASGNVMSTYSTDAVTLVTLQTELPLYGSGRLGVAMINPTTIEYDYELKDHLGNVRAVVRRNASTLQLELSYWTDFYPHGSVMPGRFMSSTTPGYRHGYQGDFAEKDEETGWDAFELRMYDSNLGRWFAPDPYGQYHSPYLAMGNNPVSGVDPDGGIDDIFLDDAGNELYREVKPGPDRYFKATYDSPAEGGISIGEFKQIEYTPGGMKPAALYNYNLEVIPGKFTEDLSYIISGKDGNPFSRAANIFVRDWNKAPVGDKATLVLAAAGPMVRIGKFVIPAKVFHRLLKPEILKAAGDFEKIVGKNPDIAIEKGLIILEGNGPFAGKSFKTTLEAADWLLH